MLKPYEIKRIMNNNIILAKDIKSGQEIILMGKGIGFGKKKGSVSNIPKETIEKSFVAGNKTLKESYIKMLEEVNGDIVALCTELLLSAEEKLGSLSERSFIVIVDHISFSIEKLKKGIVIENPFSSEIELLYPVEYEIGQFARTRIMESLGVDVTEAEVGFIALHLHAAKQNTGVSETLKDTRMIKSMVGIIEYELDVSLSDYPRLNKRLLIHLKGYLRQLKDTKSSGRHPLYDETIKKCAQAYALAIKLGKYATLELKTHVSEEELFYLTLHIDRLIRKSKGIST